MIRCYVTDRRQGDLLAYVLRAVADGVDMIQVREKDLDTAALLALVCQIRDAAASSKTKILVNGRLDIALAAGIDGVHFPGAGLPPDHVRPFVKVMGVSCHSVDDALKAERSGADYVVFGPVFGTPGKTPVGIDALRRVVEAVRIPILAIGGIDESKTTEVMATGAAGIAAIRMFQRK